jgi:hypothetical protein
VLSLGGVLLAVGLKALFEHFSASDAARIDTRRVAIESAEGNRADWIPEGWSAWLAARLAAHGPVSSLDREARGVLTAEIEASPFVRSVISERVLWPDGFALEVELRQPVASLRTRDGRFRIVAADGTVLPGLWPTPPEYADGVLPVVGPNDGALYDLRPGDVLAEERHLDALSVAVSLGAHLSGEESRCLGPVLIDAELARASSVAEPGTRLFLEDRRLVFFGRAPREARPGELPEAHKWAHLRRAIDVLGEGADWDLLDVRWDRGRIRYRDWAG